MGQTRRQFLKTTAVGAGAAASTISFPMVSRGQTKKLVVWWNRGYYKEEDESMLKIAEEFRKAKNVDLDISFTIQEDLRNKIISALTARRGPDVAFCFYNDWEIMPKYAWEGQLVETTDTINELKPRYIEKFLEVAYCYDNKAKKRAYYGVPIEAQTMHSHYWKDLVKEAGLPDAKGAVVEGVVEGSPAERAGMKKGDVIVAVGDQPVATPPDLTRRIAGTAPGTRVALTVIRDRKRVQVAVDLGRLPERR